MKKGGLILAALLVGCVVSVQAQELYEALKLSDLSVSGTARSVSMSGAFGALGGDASSLITNPAGMGIYNLHEATITANNVYSKHTAGGREPAADSNDRITFSEAAYVHAFKPAGKKYLLASNFGFAYHRLKNFQNTNVVNGYQSSKSIMGDVAARGEGVPESAMLEDENPYGNERIGWLPVLGYQSKVMVKNGGAWQSVFDGRPMVPKYTCEEDGEIDEFDVSYAANVANWFYIGGSIGIQTLEYSLKSSYLEDYGDKEGVSVNNSIITKGTGLNFKVGALLRPADWVRFGFAYHTPTFYSLNSYAVGSMESWLLDAENNVVNTQASTPEGNSSYKFRTAQRYLFNLGFVIGKKALIGVDYDIVDYRLMRYGKRNESSYYGAQNVQINNSAKISHVVKLGAEYRPVEWMSIRLGAALTTPTVKGETEKYVADNSIGTSLDYMVDRGSFYASGGVGFRWSSWGIDLAYQFRQQGAKFVAYNGSNDITVNNYYHNVLITGSFRF